MNRREFLAAALATGAASEPDRYLLVNDRGEVLDDRWPGHERQSIPGASLVKPFTALAYAAANGYRYPELECRRCWREQGHGRIGIVEAIAQSCNSYFEGLAEDLDPRHLWSRYGLAAPTPLTPQSLTGEGGVFQAAPVTLIRAYLELSRRRDEPGVGEVIRGLRLAARSGTAAAVGRELGGEAALAKTGTRPCTHSRVAPGDGLTAALYPADRPRYAVLVWRHGVPGSITAQTAGRILAAQRGYR